MNINWHKEYFNISLSYGTQPERSGILIEPVGFTKQLLDNRKLMHRIVDHGTFLYFTGIQKDLNSSLLTTPTDLDDGNVLYFVGWFINHALLNDLIIFPDSNSEKIGFPLYLEGEATNNSPDVPLLQLAIPIVPRIFRFSVTAADAGISLPFAGMTVKNAGNEVVYSDTLNLKDGFYSTSVDMSVLPTGKYKAEVGSNNQSFILDASGELLDSHIVVAIRKNNFLEFNKDLNNNSFKEFAYHFEEN